MRIFLWWSVSLRTADMMVPTRRRRLLPLCVHVDRSGFRQSDRRRFSTCSNLLWYITNTVSAACDCHFTCLLLIEKQTEPLKPNPTRPAASQANMWMRGFTTTYSSTSSCFEDDDFLRKCDEDRLLRRRYRVVLLAASVGQSPEHFYIGSALCCILCFLFCRLMCGGSSSFHHRKSSWI